MEGPRNMKFGQVIAFKNTKNLYESLFQFFVFLAIFRPFYPKKCDFWPIFTQKCEKMAKNTKNWKSEQYRFFVSLKAITWPNFMFLGPSNLDFYSKTWFWNIAILVKIRDFPWFWPNFGHIMRDKTPTRHSCGIFSLLPCVTHRITWENTLKPVRMTKTWWKLLF